MLLLARERGAGRGLKVLPAASTRSLYTYSCTAVLYESLVITHTITNAFLAIASLASLGEKSVARDRRRRAPSAVARTRSTATAVLSSVECRGISLRAISFSSCTAVSVTRMYYIYIDNQHHVLFLRAVTTCTAYLRYLSRLGYGLRPAGFGVIVTIRRVISHYRYTSHSSGMDICHI